MAFLHRELIDGEKFVGCGIRKINSQPSHRLTGVFDKKSVGFCLAPCHKARV
jgi:hypothetical protein